MAILVSSFPWSWLFLDCGSAMVVFHGVDRARHGNSEARIPSVISSAFGLCCNVNPVKLFFLYNHRSRHLPPLVSVINAFLLCIDSVSLIVTWLSYHSEISWELTEYIIGNKNLYYSLWNFIRKFRITRIRIYKMFSCFIAKKLI